MMHTIPVPRIRPQTQSIRNVSGLSCFQRMQCPFAVANSECPV